MTRSTRFPNLDEFRARAARLGMATGSLDSAETPPAAPAAPARFPLVWIGLGVASAGWLIWWGVTSGTLAPRPGDRTVVEPTRIVAPGEGSLALDSRLESIESELQRLRYSASGTNDTTIELADRLARLENALGPVTGSIDREQAPESAASAFARRPKSSVPAARSDEPSVTAASRSMPGYGLDLGGFKSVEMLYDRWAILVAAESDVFDALTPRMVTSIDPDGSKTFRLVAGPFSDVAESGQVCDMLVRRDIACSQTMFVGEAL